MELKNTDRKIIEILQKDGRATNASVAKVAGVSEETIRRRKHQLIDQGFIRIAAILNHEKAGYDTEAIIGIDADPDKIDAVADALAEMNEVSWVSITTGTYNIFMLTILQSAQDLSTLLRLKIAKVPGVNRTDAFVNLSTKKRVSGVRV